MKKQWNYKKRKTGGLTLCRLFLSAGILSVVICSCGLSGISVAASATGFPSYVVVPAEGNYTMGEDADTTYQNGEATTGTDFYMRIESGADPGTPGTEENVPNGDPETPGGDPTPAISVSPTPTDAASNITPGPAGSDDSYTDTADGKLPKTGDYGVDKNMLLLAALLFGSGYLACDYYEKRSAE